MNLTFEKKDEPQTGCETCKHNKLEWYSAICDSCCGNNNHYEPKGEPQTDCTEALTLLWIHKFVTDDEFYRIDARLKQTEPKGEEK